MTKIKVMGENEYKWLATRYTNRPEDGAECSSADTFGPGCFKGTDPKTEMYPISFKAYTAWDVEFPETKFTGPAINNGKPVPATMKYSLGASEWLLGVIDHTYLKMTKIKVTGESEYKWEETRYANKPADGEKCSGDDTFGPACFEGTDPKSEMYPLALKMNLPDVDVVPESDEEIPIEPSLEPETHCPWHMTEGDGCHKHSSQKAKCKDGNYSFRCIAEGHGERQQCPCSLPYMCAIPQCGDGRDYCCEKSCEKPKFGGDRPCKEGEPEAEPTGEPVVDVVPTPASPVVTPSPTPLPKPCYAFARGVENVLVHAGIKVNGKSDDDKRNTCISFNRDRSSSDTAHFQRMGTWENEGAAAAIITLQANGYSLSWLKGTSEDGQRNTLITMTHACSGLSVSSLQKKKTLDIAMLMNKDKCCP